METVTRLGYFAPIIGTGRQSIFGSDQGDLIEENTRLARSVCLDQIVKPTHHIGARSLHNRNSVYTQPSQLSLFVHETNACCAEQSSAPPEIGCWDNNPAGRKIPAKHGDKVKASRATNC